MVLSYCSLRVSLHASASLEITLCYTSEGRDSLSWRGASRCCGCIRSGWADRSTSLECLSVLASSLTSAGKLAFWHSSNTHKMQWRNGTLTASYFGRDWPCASQLGLHLSLYSLGPLPRHTSLELDRTEEGFGRWAHRQQAFATARGGIVLSRDWITLSLVSIVSAAAGTEVLVDCSVVSHQGIQLHHYHWTSYIQPFYKHSLLRLLGSMMPYSFVRSYCRLEIDYPTMVDSLLLLAPL